MATILLSLLTGKLLGNSIIEAREEDKSCPEGYQVVFVQDEEIYVVRERSFSSSGKVKVKDGYYCRPEAGGDGSGG